ncbi:hypothetical protein I6J18_09120 [Peribacillus psychrosaccharolyticus]|uniref:Uncharacterized protein n=1 Tax=Peribacillus psychrosaccharolyticus TaxID=1407 RepID=A0A974NQI6_PERPY|nr:hypothetical protein [Peribacillus psychrosaccharolyticus]MEC2055120.1 hypothetical protein [Peribacillus psychrosaccharolyticus]MED3743828.1 hypothetical protein [Peribacillus psychrosaccharolyticus]QQT01972.1 hypothetical protein I6J18_09120 [Peribacillus psychrosaccharolyticus]
MTKEDLFKVLHSSARGNFFTIELEKSRYQNGDEVMAFANELEAEGKIKIREFKQLKESIYLQGIIKYSSN